MRTDAPDPSAGSEAGIAILAVGGTLLCLGTAAGWNLGTWLNTGHFGLGHWSPWHAVALAAVFAPLIALIVLGIRWFRAKMAAADHVDRKASQMGDPAKIGEAAARKAAVVGKVSMLWDETAAPGLHYANAVSDGSPLFMNWRETAMFEVGMGGYKSTGLIIPLCDQAPGNLMTSSMKIDVPNAIRWLAEQRGTFYCLDISNITGYYDPLDPPWCWNPLAEVTEPVEALRLATTFADVTNLDNASRHNFFDQKGPDVLASIMLAAAIEGHQLPQVFRWLQDPDDDEPARILEYRFPLSSAFLDGVYHSKSESAYDIFQTASNALRWLMDPKIQAWVTDDGTRPRFSPTEFVKPYYFDARRRQRRIKRDTLILMSRKGEGSVAPITSALAAMVIRAAQVEASRWPHGRLPVPLVMPLDEAPNTAPIRNLPDDFTVLGSHGITPIVCVQNWAQACLAWQDRGAMQLWNGSSTRAAGSGLADPTRLAALSKLTGQCWELRRSASGGGAGPETRQVGRERAPLLDADEIAALDGGRILVFASGSYAVLGRLLPWWQRPELNWKVEKSLALYEPEGASL